MLLLVVLSLFAAIYSAPLDDYVWKADPNYGWQDLGEEHRIDGRAFGFTVCFCFLKLILAMLSF